MTDNYVFVNNLADVRVDDGSILSKTLQNDTHSKVIQFCFAPGQELSAHTAPFPATISIVRGEAELTLGADRHQAGAGAFVYMPARLEHGIKAKTEVVMLLTMLKGAQAKAG